jgi:glycerol kinase
MADAGRPLTVMKIDGGAAGNDLLAQFQADVASVEVVRPTEIESTGRGAAMLAGVGAGLCDLGAAARMIKLDRSFKSAISEGERAVHLARWSEAIGRTRAKP